MSKVFIAFLAILVLSVCSYGQVGTAPAGTVRVVSQISFAGNTVVSSSVLEDAAKIKQGNLVTAAKVQRAVLAIEEAYRQRGYSAVVTPEVAEDGGIVFSVTEVRVAEVRITGLHKTREFVVRRMLELKPGDLYYTPALSRDADRINGLGIFDTVDANVEPTETPGKVNIIWKIAEKSKTGNIQLGGSYSPSDRLILDVTYTESNLRGRAEQLGVTANVGTLRARLGGEIFYVNPWVANNLSLSLSGYDKFRYRFSQSLTSVSSGYSERIVGGQASTTKTLSQVTRFTTGVRYENVKVDNLSLSQMTTSLVSPNGSVAAVSGTLGVDKRDSTVYPTTGRLWRAVVEPAWASPTAESSTAIVKFNGQLQRYLPLGKVPIAPVGTSVEPVRRPTVLAGRLIAGTSAGRLPFFEQYFIGGVNGPRGYTESRFWGKHMVFGTAELRQPITRRLIGVGFVDAGDAWGSRFQFAPGTVTDFGQDRDLSLHAGAGVGIRYSTPYGPLGLDFAWGEGFHTHLVLGPVF